MGREHVWRSGEVAAREAYRRRGYRLLARNWRCSLGELDLIVAGPGVVVFCEVKARREGARAEPFESVTPAKRRKVRALAQAFLAGRGWRAPECRFDVASVTVNASGRARVDVYEDAF